MLDGNKPVDAIEFLLVDAMTAFHFADFLRTTYLGFPMRDTQILQMSTEVFRKLGADVHLDLLDGKGQCRF